MALPRAAKELPLNVVPESPAVKRQKTSSGYQSLSNSAGYNSENDSGDDLFGENIPSTPPEYVTQPTQILDRVVLKARASPARSRSPEIQIPASSPFRQQESAKETKAKQNGGGRLASLMAPAGTLFKAPHGIAQQPPSKKSKVIDISDDDGPQYKGGFSDDDEESRSRSNIKPSKFVSRSNKSSFGDGNESATRENGRSHFDAIIAKSAYNPAEKRQQAATLQTTNLKSSTLQVQSKPERARPVEDITLEGISDERLRDKVRRLHAIFPLATYLVCKETLINCKSDFDDASALLAEKFVDLSSDEGRGKSEALKLADKAPQMKHQLKQPIKSIHDRFTSTQNLSPKPSPVSPVKEKSKKRLVRGRKAPSSPAAASSPVVVAKQKEVQSDYDSYDSAVASATDEDLESDGRFLKYLNSCTASELADLSNITEATAVALLALRPFKNLEEARQFSNAPQTRTGRRSTKAPAGEKIVNTALDMWNGYEAVDALVEKCDQIAKPLKAEMDKWGFNLRGATKEGELELVTLEEGASSPRDSGIGTPTSMKNAESGDEDIKMGTSRKDRKALLKQPETMSESIVLKDYQVVGLNWLSLLYRQKLSCILADEMGLGKTCQVIAFLTHLKEIGITGPHLVIVPGSTLENWLREFRQFSPSLVVEPYYGSIKDRPTIGDSILSRRDEINAVVTTYDLAAKKDDNKFLRRLGANVCVYDEGHMLKNPEALRYQGLIRIPAVFRLLLTGTPLQNNLKELAAILSFILPGVFNERREELDFVFKHKATTRDADHAALLSAQRISRARSMLTPFVLRRKKQQVLKHMPAKICRVEYCDLHPAQAIIYNGHIEQARERSRLRLEGGKFSKSDENNPLMQLRKAALHPQLFRRHFSDAKIETMANTLRKRLPEHFNPSEKREHLIQEMRKASDFWLHQWCAFDYPVIASFDVPKKSWMDSGKIAVLVRLLREYKVNGDRVLIFSQFSLMLDILEAVLDTERVEFTRIDGSTKIDERQTLIDQFRDRESITAFLLTTKAGGQGINLTYANKVVIFDGSFNPQDDVQAENRAHRVGQAREVEVVRLITRGTIEEQILALGQSKLALDSKVAGDDKDTGGAEAGALRGEEMVSRMLVQGPAKRVEAVGGEEVVENAVENAEAPVEDGSVEVEKGEEKKKKKKEEKATESPVRGKKATAKARARPSLTQQTLSFGSASDSAKKRSSMAREGSKVTLKRTATGNGDKDSDVELLV